MGWNGSGGGSTPVKPKVTAKKPSPIRGIVAGALVCVLAIGAYFAFFHGLEKPQKGEDEKRPKRIKEVNPAAAPKAEVRNAETNTIKKVRKPRETYVDEKGVLRYKGGMVVMDPPVREIDLRSGKPQIFNHYSEIEIQGLMEIEPGDFVVGQPIYGKHFEEDFLKSCEEPIIVSKDDDEETASMKRAMIDVKIELRDRMAKGEKLGEILRSTREELQKLGMYREQMRNELREILQQGKEANGGEISREEAQDYVDAANKMLKDKGLPPISMPAGMFARAMKKGGNFKGKVEGK